MMFLLPIVRKSVGVAAGVLAGAAAGACVLSALEMFGTMAGFLMESRQVVGAAFVCGMLAQVFFAIQLTLAALLAPWCVHVLLGRGGNEPLRLLSWMGASLGVAVFVNKAIALAAGGHAFMNTALAGVVLTSLLGVLILSSTPYFQAAPRRLQAALWGMALLYPAVAVLDSPAVFMGQDAATALLGLLQFSTALRLARTAPKIVSMPADDEDARRH